MILEKCATVSIFVISKNIFYRKIYEILIKSSERICSYEAHYIFLIIENNNDVHRMPFSKQLYIYNNMSLTFQVLTVSNRTQSTYLSLNNKN